MKFILQENKFILNENKQFLLDEHFKLDETILSEAGATLMHLKIAIKDLEILFPRVLKAVEVGLSLNLPNTIANTAQIAQQIKDASQTTQDLLVKKKNFKDLLTKMKSKVDEKNAYSKEDLINIEPLCNRIEEDMNSVISRFSNISHNKGNLAIQLNNLRDTLLQLNTNIEKLYSFIEEYKQEYKLLRSKIVLKIGDTYKLDSLIEATPKLKPGQEINATFEVVANKDIATITNKNVLKAVAVGSTLIKITVEDFTFKCLCKIEANDRIATKNGIDWKTKLASARNKETVIEEFIYTIWPEKAKEVLKIKSAVLQECEHYGFLTSGSNLNPFIKFISDVYLNSSYQIRPQTYNVIHNLVADNYLKGKDLIGTGLMKKGNLIFCKALYQLEDEAIKMYIRKQHNILQAVNRPEMFKSNAEMAFNILYAVSKVQTEGNTQFAIDMQLRSMAQIEQLEQKWTKTVSSTMEKNKITKNNVATNAELLKQITDTASATKLLVAMAIKFSSNEEITALVRSYAETRKLMSENTTLDNIQKLVASIENLYKITNINASQALSLIKSIVDSDHFEFTKE